MEPPDASNILFGGVGATILAIFLVQTIRETARLELRWLPIICLVVGLGMMLAAYVMNDELETHVANGLLLAASISLTVRYLKNGKPDDTERPAKGLVSVQEYNPPTEGVVERDNRPRALSTLNDVLEFGIGETLDTPPIIYKATGVGILQADDGSYEVSVSADETERTNLPLHTYWYAVRITGGDSSERYPVLIGRLHLTDLPFSV